MTATLIYPPERDGYSFAPGYGNIVTKLDGGASRVRKDVNNAAHTIQARWTLRSSEYTDFMGFFRTDLQDGTLPFLCDLLTDIGAMVLHKARCKDGKMPELVANKGDGYFVAGELEVEQNPTFTGDVTYLYDSGAGLAERVSAFQALGQWGLGDQLRVIGAILNPTNPSFNYDGTYTITTDINSTTKVISGARFTNSAWIVTDGVPHIIRSTITRIPT